MTTTIATNVQLGKTLLDGFNTRDLSAWESALADDVEVSYPRLPRNARQGRGQGIQRAPTGKKGVIKGVLITAIKNGKIVREETYWNQVRTDGAVGADVIRKRKDSTALWSPFCLSSI